MEGGGGNCPTRGESTEERRNKQEKKCFLIVWIIICFYDGRKITRIEQRTVMKGMKAMGEKRESQGVEEATELPYFSSED